MAKNQLQAVAYYRTSSAANVGEDKDSRKRQEAAVRAYAKRQGIEIVAEFYDVAVSGTDAIDQRPEFTALLQRVQGNGVRLVLVEDPTRFARDLTVQLIGHQRLKDLGVELVAVNAPEHFREDTPTAVLVRQVLGAISQFEKAQLVSKLRAARKRIRDKTGRCEGRKPIAVEVVQLAKKLRASRRKPPMTLREIAEGLETAGHLSHSGKRYSAQSVNLMLARRLTQPASPG